MINSHPSLSLLTDYASGSLKLVYALSIATHIEQCEQCAKQVATLSRVGAELFNQQSVPTTDNMHHSEQKKRIMTMLDCPVDDKDIVRNVVKKDTTRSVQKYKIPTALQQFINTSYDELKWTSASPSIKVAALYQESDGTQVALTRVKAGGKMPHHAHTGDEITAILEGSFSDESGLYKKGDFIMHDQHHKHRPIVTNDAECICLTILTGPIQFTGFFTRLLNPLLRRQYT